MEAVEERDTAEVVDGSLTMPFRLWLLLWLLLLSLLLLLSAAGSLLLRFSSPPSDPPPFEMLNFILNFFLNFIHENVILCRSFF
mgnify:CR=1 FL=1